jgi:hypothetical protein
MVTGGQPSEGSPEDRVCAAGCCATTNHTLMFRLQSARDRVGQTGRKIRLPKIGYELVDPCLGSHAAAFERFNRMGDTFDPPEDVVRSTLDLIH